MDCLVLPMSMLIKCYMGSSRLGYRPIAKDGFSNLDDGPVTVVVGKEKREFLVDPFVLEESPFQLLIETVRKDGNYNGRFIISDDDDMRREKKVIFMDQVDAILFEHMLWLMHNDTSSLFQLNLKEIIDFYAQDY